MTDQRETAKSVQPPVRPSAMSAAPTIYWFADIDPDQPEPWQWQPCLETSVGHIPCLDTWFDSKQACEEWMVSFLHRAPVEATS